MSLPMPPPPLPPRQPWKLLTIGVLHDRLLVKVEMNSLLSKADVAALIAQLQSFVDEN